MYIAEQLAKFDAAIAHVGQDAAFHRVVDAGLAAAGPGITQYTAGALLAAVACGWQAKGITETLFIQASLDDDMPFFTSPVVQAEFEAITTTLLPTLAVFRRCARRPDLAQHPVPLPELLGSLDLDEAIQAINRDVLAAIADGVDISATHSGAFFYAFQQLGISLDPADADDCEQLVDILGGLDLVGKILLTVTRAMGDKQGPLLGGLIQTMGAFVTFIAARVDGRDGELACFPPPAPLSEFDHQMVATFTAVAGSVMRQRGVARNANLESMAGRLAGSAPGLPTEH